MKKVAGIALGGVLLVSVFADLLNTDASGLEIWLTEILSVIVTATALMLARERQVLPRTMLRWTSLALAVGSALITLVLGFSPEHGMFGWAETVSLLILVAVMSRRWAGTPDSVVLTGLFFAVVAVPWRAPDTNSVLITGLSVIVMGVIVSLGVRELSTARKLQDVRNEERQSIARDLHDDVAHHVTGIIVAAQAAAVVAGDSGAAQAALKTIEQAGIEALQSMRSIVSVLRTPDLTDDDKPSDHRTARWPDDLTELLERFERTTGLSTSLTVIATRLPVIYRQAAQRVVQEALTNISRHARNATRADVVIAQDDQAFRITVTDDGRLDSGSRSRLSRSGGGFGLIGLQERAKALGGLAEATTREQGGWQVKVTLPATENYVQDEDYL